MAATASDSTRHQPLVEEVIAVIGEALGEIKCIGSERMARTGLSMTHWHLLILLARHGELSMSRLAEVQGISLSNATGLVDRLDERGLIERVRVPDDRRVVMVRVSGAGREQIAAVDLLREELIRHVVERLDETQLERLSASLSDVRGALNGVLTDNPDPLLRDHFASYAHAAAHDPSARPPEPTAPAAPQPTVV